MRANALTLLSVAAAFLPVAPAAYLSASALRCLDGFRMASSQSMPTWKQDAIFFLAKGRELRKCNRAFLKDETRLESPFLQPSALQESEVRSTLGPAGRSTALTSTRLLVAQALRMMMAVCGLFLRAHLGIFARARASFRKPSSGP